MHLKAISTANFKNIRETTIDFSERLNCFIGDNGAGKTNMLDAIYYLSFTKSFFNSIDQMNVCHGENWFMIKGLYERHDAAEQIICSFQDGQKKQVKRNTKSYRKMSEHIGLLPLVMVSPGDANLILGGSDERRKFIDGVISQYDAVYLANLLRYNRTLMQRNNLLKQAAQDNRFDDEVIETYDYTLNELGANIYEKRREFIEKLEPVFQRYYTRISNGIEQVELFYQSDLERDSLEKLLRENRVCDRKLQFTTAGVHKDDLMLKLSGYPIKKLGSQGQQKTYLIALKLAQFDFIRQISGIRPILLLDDIFDKLDKKRVEQIIKMVDGEQFGQIFITDTNREHLDSILLSAASGYNIYNVSQGNIEIVS